MAQDIFASTPSTDLRKRWALMQIQQGTDSSPVRHPLQAVARVLQGAAGGYLMSKAEEDDKAAGDAWINSLPGLSSAQAAAAPTAQPTQPAQPQQGGQFNRAIANIESGGKYDLLGPVTKTGDRAYGKYQVMGANIGPWTKEVLGQEMTPQQFAASPQAQDAVFNAKFGQYAQKYGPEGAARAWFAGEGGMNDLNRKDQLGTTVGQYAQKFNAGLGQPSQPPAGQQPYQVAQAGGAVPPPPAQPGAMPAPGPAPGGRSPVQIPPEVAASIRALGSNPATRPQALQLYMQYAKPVEQYVQGVDENGVPYQKNTLTGEIKADPRKVDRYVQGVDENGIPYQRNAATGKIEADPRKDPAIQQTEFAQKNWKQLGFPDPASASPDDKKFWQDFNAKRLGGPSTNVTVDQRGENEFSKEAGKLSAKRYNDMVDDVPAAKQMLSDVQTLTTLGSQIGTGKEAEIKAKLGPYAQALGIDVEKLPEIQAFEAIVNRVAPNLRVKGSGSQSDYELKNFLKSLPALGTTPEGNELAGRVMQGLYENKLKAGEIASSVLNGDLTRKEADKMIRELPDPMQSYRDFVKQNPGAKVRPNDEGGWTVIDGVKIKAN